MKAVAIIPARMESSRFPGKPLENIHGIPMIGHCYCRSKLSDTLIDTYVATCNEEIYSYINSIGGKAIMTSSKHERASDRTSEAMHIIEHDLGFNVDVIVMVQGDEPMITPNMINASLEPFNLDQDINVVNLMSKIISNSEFEDPNEVKVVFNNLNEAIYFSREPIPSKKKGYTNIPMYKQVCIISFKRDYLIEFNNMPEGKLERIESIDMLRIIENKGKIKMVEINQNTYSVDTKSDLLKVEKKMSQDKLINLYK